jgi:hypothetical protein
MMGGWAVKIYGHSQQDGRNKSTGGEVANALVCKTSIHGFKSHPVLQ